MGGAHFRFQSVSHRRERRGGRSAHVADGGRACERPRCADGGSRCVVQLRERAVGPPCCRRPECVCNMRIRTRTACSFIIFKEVLPLTLLSGVYVDSARVPFLMFSPIFSFYVDLTDPF